MKPLKAILLAFTLFLSWKISAQIDSISHKQFRNWVDSSIKHLNFNDVNSGILFEKSAMSENNHFFQGLANDSFGSISDLIGHYRQVFYGRVNGAFDSLTHPDSVYTKWRAMSTGRLAAISLLYTRFDTLAEQGVNDTPFFREYDSILYDNPNRTGSPYIEDTLFVCATQQQIFVHGKLKFVFPSSHLFALGLDSFLLEADFGNGCGWRTIKADSVYNILYQDSGQYIVMIRITPEDGRAFLAKLLIEIYHGSWVIPMYEPLLTNLPHIWNDDVKQGVQAYIFPADNEATCLTKPYIFVEGFDPLDERNEEELKRLLQEKDPDLTTSYYNQLVAKGYDIIILNFANTHGGDKIQENAAVLERLINWINLHKCGNEKLVVSGASMGSLISRYCLAKMEHECKDHQTRLYISMDAGHHGVNIPLGMQYMTQDAKNHSPKFIQRVHDSYKMLTVDASRQMLVSSFEVTGGVHPLCTTLMAELNSYGLPQQCRNIAFSLGNTLTQDAYYTLVDYNEKQVYWVDQVAPNERIFEWELSKKKDDLEVWVATVAQNYSQDICYSRYGRKKWFGGKTKNKINKTYSFSTIPGNHDTRRGSVVTTHYDVYRAIDKLGLGSVTVHYNSYHTMIHANSAFYIVDNHKDNDNLGKYPHELVSEWKTDFDNVAVTNNTYAYRHVIITEALRDFMLNEIDLVSGIPITRHLNVSLPFTFAPQSSTPYSSYNFGESLRGQHLNTVDINSGGTVYVNKGGATEYGNGPNNKSSHFILESQPCSYINVYSGGIFEVGSSTTSAVVRIKNGSIFDLRGGGILRIHNGSTLIIEDGATFVFNPNALIYLQGNSAVLEIRGSLTVKNNAIFTFSSVSSPTGFIRFAKDGTSGTKLITAEGTNAQIYIEGASCADKVLEIDNCSLTPEYSNISSSHYFASVTIKKGHIKYSGSNPALTCGSPCNFSNLHLEHSTGATSSKGLVTKGQASCTLSTIKFNGLTTGLYADNSVNGNDISIDNSRFVGGNTGMQVAGEGMHLNNCYFIEQAYNAVDADIENNSTITGSGFFGNLGGTDKGVLVEGTGTVSLVIDQCEFESYNYAVYASGSSTSLVSECSKYSGNDIGISAQSGVSLDLSGASGFTGGSTHFVNNASSIELNTAKLYLKDGNNTFKTINTTNPLFITGVISSSQTSQLNSTPNPALLDITSNYFAPSIPGSLDPDYVDLLYPTGGGTYKGVWLTGTALSSEPAECFDYDPDDDLCTVSAKTSSPGKSSNPKKKEDKNIETVQKITVYPNPGDKELYIESGNESIQSVLIYDMTGKIVSRTNFSGSQSVKVELSNLPNGIYYVEVQTGSGVIRQKLSIHHE